MPSQRVKKRKRKDRQTKQPSNTNSNANLTNNNNKPRKVKQNPRKPQHTFCPFYKLEIFCSGDPNQMNGRVYYDQSASSTTNCGVSTERGKRRDIQSVLKEWLTVYRHKLNCHPS